LGAFFISNSALANNCITENAVVPVRQSNKEIKVKLAKEVSPGDTLIQLDFLEKRVKSIKYYTKQSVYRINGKLVFSPEHFKGLKEIQLIPNQVLPLEEVTVLEFLDTENQPIAVQIITTN
jgi:hypothetical protein